ncbi:MAG: sensor histidine kinase protein [Gammaproteobacteria bacterium]|jgi:signal transduction histidine kinase|nr:sensor histidine kinase protein [Gammaproteobacteria bacterium]
MTIKKLFLISLILLILETGLFATYNYLDLQDSGHKQSNSLLVSLLQLRLSLLFSANKNPGDFNSQLSHLEVQTQNLSGLDVSQTDKAPDNAVILSADEIAMDTALNQSLQSELLQGKNIKIATYFPQIKQWVIFTAHYNPSKNWRTSLMLLSTNLTLLLIVWIGFLFYYRYTLPKEVMNSIIGSSRYKRADRIISNLQQKIQSYFDEKNLMIYALAHDIKTPLTEAILRLELLKNEEQAPLIRENLESINNIVTSSLEYAKEPEQVKKIEVDVVSLIESLADRYQNNEFEVRFRTEIEHFEMQIELELFKRMIINILENSKKYASSCELAITHPKRKLFCISCRDDGPGVPDKFLHLLSIPYFRVDQSRSSKTGGTGLGLAIVKKIAEIHHGSVHFANLPGGGFEVSIEIDIST